MKFDANKLVVLERHIFPAGKLLTAEDLRAEQEYQRQKQWQHNRMLHGYGIVAGLEILVDDSDGHAQVVVSPGYALDGWGRELVLAESQQLVLPGDKRDLVVYIRYVEKESVRENGEAADDARVVESTEILLERPPADRAATPLQRPDYAIPLARLRRPHLSWQRERTFRPPRTR